MNKTIIIFILSIITLLGCDSNHDQFTNNVIFYTNAQAVLNCGLFDVEIYMDSSLVGVIKEPLVPLDSTPDCNSTNSETILVIDKPEGEYEFTARLTCSETLKYLGTFIVNMDSCSLVYVDLTYGE